MAPGDFDSAAGILRGKEKGPARGRAKVLEVSPIARNLRAALGGPGAGAIARCGGPGAGAVTVRHAARAGRALAAARDGDDDRALGIDLAGNREGGAARIADGPVLNLDRIAIGAIALALLGHDQDAPGAVKAR